MTKYERTNRKFMVGTLIFLAGFMGYTFGFLVPEVREANLNYRDKCEAAGGEVIYLNNSGRRCLKPDSFIEIE